MLPALVLAAALAAAAQPPPSAEAKRQGCAQVELALLRLDAGLSNTERTAALIRDDGETSYRMALAAQGEAREAWAQRAAAAKLQGQLLRDAAASMRKNLADAQELAPILCR